MSFLSKFVFFMLVWASGVTYSFNKYAYSIEQVNASIRTLVTKGSWDLRSFDENGIPISTSPKAGDFISPFYVVHYGLIYSDGLLNDGVHWLKDDSFEYWNVKPPNFEKSKRVYFFKEAANWLLDNVEFYNGKAHFIYDFDWEYKSYPTGGLKTPWWSGLTDSYAIILLLRAADYFNDKRYYDLATELYSSVTADISKGGSLNTLDGCHWIEEYVDPKVDKLKMSYVLNGMIYSTYAVDSYESYSLEPLPSNGKVNGLLYSCINDNLKRFDKGGWLYYDLIGNEANVKYFKITYSLIQKLYRDGKLDEDIYSSMNGAIRAAFENPGLYYMMYGPVSVSYFHFIFFYLSFLLSPLFLLFLRVFYVRK